MGASLGGPQALSTILTQLPSSFPVPIFIVQHISEGFTEGFVDWIKPHLKLDIQLARHQTKAQPRTVYVALDRCHLEVSEQGEMHLVQAPPESGARPSVARAPGREFRQRENSRG